MTVLNSSGFEAGLIDGSALPDWLSFDGRRFKGTPPEDRKTQNMSV